MSSDAQDIAVARYLKQEGLVTPEQLQKALQAQATAVDGGKPISLAAALLAIGAITPGQRDVLEKRLKGEEKKGTQQISHYKLKKKLGEGGMGAVYLAEDTRDGKKIALKVLPRKHAADPEFLKRFRREADAARRLDHPNIVRAFEAGEEANFHFYAMEYCEGEPLDRALKRTGLFSWHRAFEIVRDVSKGLQYAHAQGFIHRDIKPANIFMTAAGMPKILDLGLTKKIDESQLSFQTMSGAVVGTPHYLSPEQAKGDKSIDGRTDIYSLGATLYHLLTGEPPFSGTTLYEILSKHVNAELPNPQDVAEDIPDGIVHVLRRMMAKAPSDRYPDCGELLKDVNLVLQGRTPESAALGAGASAVAHLRKQIVGARRKRAGTYRVPLAASPRKSQMALLWGGVAAAAVIVIVLAVALASGGNRADPPDVSPPVTGGKPPPVARTSEQPKTSKTDPEETAKNKLDGLLRTLNGPPPAEKEKRVAELGRFIEGNPGTFAAATAQGMVNNLRKGSESVASKPVDESWIAEVQKLTPDEQVRRVTEKLKSLNPDFNKDKAIPRIEDGKVIELSLSAVALTDISPIQALRDLRALEARGDMAGTVDQWRRGTLSDLSPLKGMRLERLDFMFTSVIDLSPVADIPLLKSLRFGNNGISDLKPISHLALTRLAFQYNPISDLSPLARMKLVSLNCVNTKVNDLTPLRGMPLEDVHAINTNVTDLSPLAGMRLTLLDCDFDQARDATIVKSIETLENINGLPVAEFWKKYETNVVAQGPNSERSNPGKVDTLAPALHTLWKVLLDNKARLKGQPVVLALRNLEGATILVEDVRTDGLALAAKLIAGGTAYHTEKPESLSEQVILDLLRKAVGDPTPELRKTIALLYADRGKFDEARRELERAKAGGSDVAEVSRRIEEKAKEGSAGEGTKTNPPPTVTLDLGGGVTMEMIYIKPGTFMMGGTLDVKFPTQADERPQHRVTITKGFYLGKYEVTRGQFTSFVRATGYKTVAEREGNAVAQHPNGAWEGFKGVNWQNPNFTQTDDHPVICVSWNDAKAFCEWAEVKTKRGTRLPTEAEWEYACRAGAKTKWAFGDDESAIGDYAWYASNSGMQTHLKGQKRANAWGLHDMHGNVWEWCQDWSGAYVGEETDPTGGVSGEFRSGRSSGWASISSDCRSAFRRKNIPTFRATDIGFRVALTPSVTGMSVPSRPAHVPPDAKEFGGHYYKLFEEKLKWHEAKNRCEEMGGHLVTIESANESEFIEITAPRQDTWLGLTDEGREGAWVWVTGEPLLFTLWRKGDPDNRGRAEHWASVMWAHNRQWNDSGEQVKLSFICEWEPYRPVDLLKIIDTSKDGKGGAWSIEQGALITAPTSGHGCFIQLPYEVPAEYDLLMSLRRLGNEPSLLIAGLTSGSNRFHLDLGYQVALRMLDGKLGPPTGATCFQSMDAFQVLFSVRKDRFTVAVDGKVILDWADYRRLSPDSAWWSSLNPRAPWFASWGCRFSVNEIKVTPVSGDGRRLR